MARSPAGAAKLEELPTAPDLTGIKACGQLIHTQSALPFPKVRRCCSPVIRAGFTGACSAGQSLPVAERQPPAWGQQVAQVDSCVDVAVVSGLANRAGPVPFPLEFRVVVLAHIAQLAAGVHTVGGYEVYVTPGGLVLQLSPYCSHAGVCLGLGGWSAHHADDVEVLYHKDVVFPGQFIGHLVDGVIARCLGSRRLSNSQL